MPKKIGLALGGGGARGWAHIGALRALEEHDIPIDCLAGTSIGALVGAFYVSDRLHHLEELAEDLGLKNLLDLMDISFPGLGLIDGQRIRDFLSGYLADTTLEQSTIPFRCVATNFLRKEEVVFESGTMVDAIRASISIPGVFAPCQHENIYLVDGGVVNPVPVTVVKAMGADVVIAVNLNHDPKTLNPDSQSNSSSTSKSPSPQTDDPSAPSPEGQDQSDGQQETGLAQGLIDRYENLKGVLQDQIDDWMPDPTTGMNIFDVIGNSMNMMEQQVTHVRLQTDAPQVLIEPDLMEFGIFDFRQAKPMIQKGYEATVAMMDEIKPLVED